MPARAGDLYGAFSSACRDAYQRESGKSGRPIAAVFEPTAPELAVIEVIDPTKRSVCPECASKALCAEDTVVGHRWCCPSWLSGGSVRQ